MCSHFATGPFAYADHHMKKGAVTKWLIILPQPYFNWDIPLKDYLTFISIDLVWIPNNLAALEGNEPP